MIVNNESNLRTRKNHPLPLKTSLRSTLWLWLRFYTILFGSILKDRVEERLHPVAGIPSFDVLEREVISVLTAMEEETSLFVRLLESYPRRVKAVVAANGGHTKY